MIRKSIVAGGGSTDYLDHRAPIMKAKSLTPALVSTMKVEITATPLKTSEDVISSMVKKGALVEDIPLAVYREASEGKPRLLDNSDCLVGYDPIYDDQQHFHQMTKASHDVIKWLTSEVLVDPDHNYWHRGELEDLNKVCQQRWRPPGWFLEPPFSLDLKLTPFAKIFCDVVDAIFKFYWAKVPASLKSMDIKDLISLDFDPSDTNTGLPVMASGDRSHEGRLLALTALPRPFYKDPVTWVNDYSRLGLIMGMPEDFIFSSLLATRHGPTKKPVTLWVKDAMGYYSTYSSVGLYDRTRFVYPIPYPVNFILSPVYTMLKSARMNILGLWHDPDSMTKYITKLKTQGQYPYSVDFSGMDTTMGPGLIKLLCQAGVRNGFPRWPLQMLNELIGRMGVVTPSYRSLSGSCTRISGVMSWMSGFKLTSEFDTLFGAATLLTALKLAGGRNGSPWPSVVDDWISGRFTFAELGDDIIFTLPYPLDIEKISKLATEVSGAILKVQEDTVFLKHMLPLNSDLPHLTRLFSRLIQQTLYNEDRYSGELGGVRPDAVMRLGLYSRLNLLEHHPGFSKIWPVIYDSIISKVGYVKRASETYRNKLEHGSFGLDEGDERAIQLYAIQNTTYMEKLYERAKFEPSAAQLLALFVKIGAASADAPDHSSVRKLYLDALLTTPDRKSVV